MSSPVIGDEAGIPVVANAVLGTPNRESISKASLRTRADWSGAVFMIKRPVLQTGVHVGRLSQAWLNRGVSHPSKCSITHGERLDGHGLPWLALPYKVSVAVE